MRKLTCPETSETIGQNLRAFTDNIKGDRTRPIMEKHGMADLDPEKWYPTRKLLDALNEIAELPDITFNMVAIGMKIGEIVPIITDDENPTLEKALLAWNDVYQGLHRTGDVGEIKAVKVGEKHYKTMHSVVYPDDLSYGIQYAYARRFLPPGTKFTVFFDPNVTPRDQGGTGKYTVIHVRWE
jgi:hypothetical protein